MEVDTSTKPEDIKTESASSPKETVSRLGSCEVCNFRAAKYTCPKCEVKTCSLKCVKIHKLEVECDGRRYKTRFIPPNKFTNLDLSDDYRLLEEITRSAEALKKKFGKNWTRIPMRLAKLRDAAKARRTELKFLPFHFARHTENTTNFSFKTDVIYWHIEWVFTNADNLKLTNLRVSENHTISALLSQHLSKETESLQQKLQFYRAVDVSGIKVYLKAEQKKGGRKFYELDPSLTLKECLRGKIIIEYPILHAVLKDTDCGYEVIDSDDECDEDRVKSGSEMVRRMVEKAEAEEESIYKAMKNYLFISEYSDEEMSTEEK